jgi:FKBP-type peptidyl-prolyl cis-trans isomerase
MKPFLTAFLPLCLIAGMATATDQTTPAEEKTPEATVTDTTSSAKEQPVTKKVEWIKTESGMQYVDLVVGQGTEAAKGMTVQVHYTGWLWENGVQGKQFDSSVPRKQPLTFRLGGGQMIKGFDEGTTGMKIGGKRQIILPPSMAYGEKGAGGVIPPNATLLFELELVSATK